MKKLQTEILIDAPVSVVWKVLLEFEQYPEWNSFIHPSGKAEVDSRLENRIFLEGRKPQTFRPVVLVHEPEKEFRWLGSMFVKGLFDGEHYFLLEAVGNDKTRFIHGEYFSGMLVGMIMKMIAKETVEGFERMNEALKKRAEGIGVIQ